MSDAVETGIMKIVERSALALEEAVIIHGPDAVDLAMRVYQIDAISDLVQAVIIIAAGFFIKAPLLKLMGWIDEGGELSLRDIAYIPAVLILGLWLILVCGVVLDVIINPFIWLSAFGSPEAMIAKSALSAAGLF